MYGGMVDGIEEDILTTLKAATKLGSRDEMV